MAAATKKRASAPKAKGRTKTAPALSAAPRGTGNLEKAAKEVLPGIALQDRVAAIKASSARLIAGVQKELEREKAAQKKATGTRAAKTKGPTKRSAAAQKGAATRKANTKTRAPLTTKPRSSSRRKAPAAQMPPAAAPTIEQPQQTH